MPTTMGRRLAAAVAAAMATVLALPGVAAADSPTNDELEAATAVTALPYTVDADTGEATRAGDDPVWCQYNAIGGTVWFDYTPAENLLLRATALDAANGVILSAYTGTRGDLVPVDGSCAVGSGAAATATFPVRAGTTYHLMVAGYFVPGGDLSLGLEAVAPAANDAFADAEPVTVLPATREIDLSVASTEYDEPAPASPCLPTVDRSVWYRYTASTTTTLHADTDGYGTAVTVYTGDSLPALQSVACASDGFSTRALFRATVGTTYWFQVTGSEDVDQATFTLSEAPPIQPYVYVSPDTPTIYELTQFGVESGEFDTPVVSGELDFGDGTVVQLDGSGGVAHHYTADGTYEVGLTATTADGRTGTSTRTVTVETHDVSVARLAVPAAARAGETAPVTVRVANTRYREQGVTAILYRSDGASWQQVGTLTLNVPKDKTVKFPFAYTFTAADAVAGKVAFRTVVSLRDGSATRVRSTTS